MRNHATRNRAPSLFISLVGLLGYAILTAAVVWGFLALLLAMA